MIDEGLKNWFIGKIRANPEYFEEKYFPALEVTIKKMEHELRQATLPPVEVSKVAFVRGELSGVQKFLTLLGGLKMSEAERPGDPGLMDRILGFTRK